MSKEGDKQSVFRTTKVRTMLKGDNSWIQRRSEAQSEQEEKPWMAEARATAVNGAFTASSPVSPPTSPAPAPTPPAATSTSPKPASSGYLIRGVFTKTDTKKQSSPSAFNGTSPSSAFIPKKPSDSYKRIAPHSVRTSSESFATAETTLSPDEQDKRTEAASNVLRTSGARQRSYVLSAAKKYETTDKSPLSPTTKNSPSFIAKRVEINDEEESASTDAQNDVTPRVPTPQDTAPEPTEQSSPAVDAQPAPSDALISPDTSSPVETQESSPAPALSVPNSSEDITAAPDEGTDTEASPAKASPQVEAEPAPVPSDVLGNDDLFTLTESTKVFVDPLPSSMDLWDHDLLSGPDSQSEKTVDTLDELAIDIISIDTGRSTLSTDRPSEGASRSPAKEQLEDTQSPEVLVDSVPSDTDLLSQELINTESLIDSFDPIPIETSSTKSPTNIISMLEDSVPKATEDSLKVLLDPVRVDTAKRFSPAEPLIPLSSGATCESTEAREDNVPDALEALSEDVVPINTDTQSSDKSSDNKPEDLFTTEKEHEDAEEEGADDAEDERKSPEQSISPWSSWRTPAVPSPETETAEESEPEPQTTPPASSDRALESSSQELSAPDSPESKKVFVFMKEYAQHDSQSGGDGDVSSQSSTYSYSNPSSLSRGNMMNCTYCGELVGSEGKITIDDLNIFCHPGCFKCGVCSRPMGDLLYNMFLHGGMVHCESCYSNVL